METVPVLPTLAIVIVNWNSGQQLRDCIASIPAAADRLGDAGRLARIVVVDNGSADGSEQGLAAGRYELTLLRNQDNRGFAAACNQGAQAARDGDLLLFLNPDTLLYPDSLLRPLRALAEPAHAKVGIAGIQLVDEHGQIARSCSRYPSAGQVLAQAVALDRLNPALGQAMREWDHRSTRAVDQVIGAFFLVRGPLFWQLGGFDERFFVYFEEVDLAYRAHQAGWSSLYLADAQAFHKGGGTSDQVRGRRLFYALRSRLAYFRKHGNAGQRAVVGLSTWLLEPPARLLLLLAGRRFAELRHLAEAYHLLLTDGQR